MQLGLTCPRFTWPGGDAAVAGRFAQVARGAEQAGVASLWVMDHFWQIPNFGAPGEPMLEAYGALSYAAAHTGRVTLGALVTGVGHRPPGLLVKQLTTLDALSGGRAVLGLGAGWDEEEHRAIGVPFPPAAERFERLEETLQIVRSMWSDDEEPYHGRHFSLDRMSTSPRLTRPRPPVLIGGSGEKRTLRLVARYADACNLFHGADVRHKLAVLREHCERVGRPYGEIEKTLHMRLPEGRSVAESVELCGEFASQGIDHVIVAPPDASDGATLGHLAELAEAIREMTPEGRSPGERTGMLRART
ncbi:probable F420-dependent oxidoreductase, Rv1855c family [Streptomyces sp. WMMB 714]|uniref:LLM class F420-dependent oxidoreductase n=1 Tax=Streptomyces sp. WMMB 714 TaxID=1286822 RepID=UPI0005F7FFB6|nr:LLM class F420-dependent oxidoreductase [Streptomyces sp. WMMB 714]SCK17075.1 probable F420-dependent oxidoreductase, Rv1855c family [Streptomyces sp. WMMB 714]